MCRAALSADLGLPSRGVERLARMLAGQAPAQPPPRSREGQVCHRREARLVGAERQQQVRRTVVGGSSGPGTRTQ